MGNTKEIRLRIQSTKNTQKITRAMKLVAAAKLRRAQQNILSMRPYAQQILQAIADIATSHRVKHPLLTASSERKNVLVVVVTSDRGLCGGFNNSVSKEAYQFYLDNKDKYENMDFLFIGRKAAEYFRNRKIEAVDTILNLAKDVSYTLASEVANRLMKNYLNGEYDEVKLVYNEFKSAIAQEVVVETLLPVDTTKATGSGDSIEQMTTKDMLFEPEPEVIIEQMLDKHFAVQVYRCMSESVAAEHAARMVAMENATKNAGEVISNLTLQYNKMRQAAITTELIEITSGAEALKA